MNDKKWQYFFFVCWKEPLRTGNEGAVVINKLESWASLKTLETEFSAANWVIKVRATSKSAPKARWFKLALLPSKLYDQSVFLEAVLTASRSPVRGPKAKCRPACAYASSADYFDESRKKIIYKQISKTKTEFYEPVCLSVALVKVSRSLEMSHSCLTTWICCFYVARCCFYPSQTAKLKVNVMAIPRSQFIVIML